MVNATLSSYLLVVIPILILWTLCTTKVAAFGSVPLTISPVFTRSGYRLTNSKIHITIKKEENEPNDDSNIGDFLLQDQQQIPDNPRNELGRAIRGFQSVAWKEAMEPGDTVVCKRTVPSLGIVENESYELRSVCAQSFDDITQTIAKEPLARVDAPVSNKSAVVYVSLYSPKQHVEPVVCTPQEVGLVSVQNELQSAAWLAIPGFFWVFVVSSFYNLYHERTGGSFMDAFWGR